ncbi:hypothetical protein FOZ61_002982 [Perkinsus olseni]|uniref:Uncharacterized protein n=1 Tax=Perkinsus olseni TaxID=32597 RepID=A0A7J6LQZ8_PEROL|nr:hypothetical protein FOZ61_002982 [Perkinsus olseni]
MSSLCLVLLAVVMSCFLAPLAVAGLLSAPCLLAPGDAMEVEVAAEGLPASTAALEALLVFCIGLAGGVLFGVERNDRSRDRTGVGRSSGQSKGGKDGAKGGRSGSRTSGHRDERREVVPVRVRKHIEKKSSGLGVRVQPLMTSLYVQAREGPTKYTGTPSARSLRFAPSVKVPILR